MILTEDKSICKRKQKIIVSEENGKKHRANNRKNGYEVRQYRMDGGLVKSEKCCDYLVLNDMKRDAILLS